MKKETLKYIRTLTRKDTKNLSQKALKVAEEAGELARAVLPYDDAAGTRHRFIAKEHILEEVADLFLTSISVAYQLGFSDEDIEEMIERKTLKWAELQTRESNVTWPIPYEIHISVKDANQEEFRQVCRALNVKPIVLALQVGEEVLDDVMTSSKHYGNNSSAYLEMKRISEGLARSGFNVVREKIETVPWHPGAPSNSQADPIMPRDCYFESHIGVHLCDLGQYAKPIRDIALRYGAHLSRNAFKKFDDGSYVQMITYRTYEGVVEDFKEKVAALRKELTEAGYGIENMVTEFSIYDTKVTHDTAWIEGLSPKTK